MAKISFDQYSEMLWQGEPTWLSPRPGLYIRFCPSCREWKPLVTRIWAPIEEADEPLSCMECTFVVRDFNGMSDADYEKVLNESVHMESMIALLRGGLSVKEAMETLGLRLDPTC